MPTINADKEYTVDTSIVRAACLNYPEKMQKQNPGNKTNYQAIQKKCFEMLMSLYNAKIAIDDNEVILSEYKRIAFNDNPQEFAAQWFHLMESQGKIVTKEAPLNETLCSEMKNHFCLSKTDCQFVHVAAKTSSQTLFHREKGLNHASGYIKKNFRVSSIHILK